MTRRGWLLFAAMGLIWGIPYLLIKVAVEDLSPAVLVFLRTGLGALLLLPIAVARGGVVALLPAWRPILVYSLVEVTLPWFLLSDAERRLSSSLTGLLVAAVPLVGLVLARALGAERLDARRLVGLVVGFLGVAALLGLDLSARDLGAVLEMGLVVLGYAIGPMIIARRLTARVPAVSVVTASLVLTGLVYAPLAAAQWPAALPSANVLGAVAVLGVICTAVAFVLFFALIAEAGPLRAQTITYVNPAVALALGVLVLGEPFTVGAGVGLALIVLGLLLSTRRGPRPGPAAAPGPLGNLQHSPSG